MIAVGDDFFCLSRACNPKLYVPRTGASSFRRLAKNKHSTFEPIAIFYIDLLYREKTKDGVGRVPKWSKQKVAM